MPTRHLCHERQLQREALTRVARAGAVLFALALTGCDNEPAAQHRDVDAAELDSSVPLVDAGDDQDGPSDHDADARHGDATLSDAAIEEPIPEPDASLEVGATFAERDPSYLFDQNVMRTFELYLSREDLAKLDADPSAEEYVPGRLAFEGGLIGDVGIRYKGSVGSFVFCLSDGIFPPKGSKTCVKLGMKIKIDYIDDDALFFKQKKLQFHAMNLDPSLLRERFSYDLFNSMGVHAPRTAHVRMLVNGKFIGIFLLVEVIDGPFSRGRFPDGGEGNLYKEVWPVGNDEARYVAALESNKKSPDVSKMIALADALSAADDRALPVLVDHWFDGDYAAKFIAIDRAIRHDDGPHHWYCQDASSALSGDWSAQRSYAGTTCGNHNYYWYEGSTSEQFWPIPWDLDNALLGGATSFTSILSDWDDLAADCSALLMPSFGAPQMPITCDTLHRGFALSLRERVRDTLQELAAGPLSETQIDAQLAPWIAQLEPRVLESNAAQLSEPNLANWQSAVQALRSAISQLRDQALSHAQQ